MFLKDIKGLLWLATLRKVRTNLLSLSDVVFMPELSLQVQLIFILSQSELIRR